MTKTNVDQESKEGKSRKNELVHNQQWMHEVGNWWRKEFAAAGYTLPENVRYNLGFLSQGKKAKATSEVLFPDAAGGYFEVIVRSDTDDALLVAGNIGHALKHVATGKEHKQAFRDAAVALGFDLRYGLTKSLPGPRLLPRLNAFLADLGPLPYSRVDYEKLRTSGKVADAAKKQEGRVRRAICKADHLGEPCGFFVNMTRSMARNPGPPLCPRKHGPLTVEWKPGEAPTNIVDAEYTEVAPVSQLEAGE